MRVRLLVTVVHENHRACRRTFRYAVLLTVSSAAQSS